MMNTYNFELRGFDLDEAHNGYMDNVIKWIKINSFKGAIDLTLFNAFSNLSLLTFVDCPGLLPSTVNFAALEALRTRGVRVELKGRPQFLATYDLWRQSSEPRDKPSWANESRAARFSYSETIIFAYLRECYPDMPSDLATIRDVGMLPPKERYRGAEKIFDTFICNQSDLPLFAKIKSSCIERCNEMYLYRLGYGSWYGPFFLQLLPELSYLNLKCIKNPDCLAALTQLPSLRFLDIIEPSNMPDLCWLQDFPNLTTLRLDNCQDLKSLLGANNLPALSYIHINWSKSLTTLVGLENLPILETLIINNVCLLEDLIGLNNLPALKDLKLSSLSSLKSLAGIENLPSLKRVFLVDIPATTNLRPLEQLPALEKVFLSTDTMPDERVETPEELLTSLKGLSFSEGSIIVRWDHSPVGDGFDGVILGSFERYAGLTNNIAALAPSSATEGSIGNGTRFIPRSAPTTSDDSADSVFQN